MEDFKVVEVTPHGHVNEHLIHHVINNTEDAAYAVPCVDRNRRYVEDYLGHIMRKRVLCHMRTTKVQISLRIRAVWSAPLLFAA